MVRLVFKGRSVWNKWQMKLWYRSALELETCRLIALWCSGSLQWWRALRKERWFGVEPRQLIWSLLSTCHFYHLSLVLHIEYNHEGQQNWLTSQSPFFSSLMIWCSGAEGSWITEEPQLITFSGELLHLLEISSCRWNPIVLYRM